MHICQLLAGNIQQIGGLEQHVLAISRGLLERSHQVTLVAHPQIEKYLPPGVKFVPLDLAKGRLHPGKLFRLWKIIRAGQFDIVHAHANKACTMLALLKPFARFNFVATLHGQKKKLWAYSRADQVIAVSRRVADRVANKNLTIIYNGVSAATETAGLRKIAHSDADEFLFCAIGRLEKVKDFATLIRAFVAVPAKLVIIGEGAERQALERLIVAHNLQDKVFLPGFLPNAAGYLSQADALVISSLREGFSYVFAEALLSGMPVISTDVADIASIINPFYVVPVAESERLAEKMRYIVAQPATALNDFKDAFDFAQTEFSYSTMMTKLVNVYHQVVC